MEIRGESQGSALLDPATRMGAVQLTVSSLARSLTFYQQVLGFQVHRQEGNQASLGAGNADILQLVEMPTARRVVRHSGLYHFAVLTPSRVALAKVLRSLIEHRIEIGGSDHLVSEAIYLSDPDGNGIEVYRDRPRAEWRNENGQLVMGSLPLDYRGILRELTDDATPWQGLEPTTTLGHMHLHVAQLPATLHFYRDIVGFELMVSWNQALFFAAGGYHHHLGTNTWAGVDAPPQPADAVGLRHYEILLTNAAEKAHLVERLEKERLCIEERAEGLFVRDPAQNGILFNVQEN